MKPGPWQTALPDLIDKEVGDLSEDGTFQSSQGGMCEYFADLLEGNE